LLTDRSINGGKGLIFTLKAVISDKNLKKAIKDAIAGDATAEDQMLTALRTVSTLPLCNHQLDKIPVLTFS
jgi:hypothetical protein